MHQADLDEADSSCKCLYAFLLYHKYNSFKVITHMNKKSYNVIITDIHGEKKPLELSRLNLDENYHRFIRYVAAFLVGSGYDVKSSTDIKDPKQRERRVFYELSFRSKTKTGLLRKKTEYGRMHSFWVGHNKDSPILNEIVFKIDGKQVAPGSVLKAISQMVENRE